MPRLQNRRRARMNDSVAWSRFADAMAAQRKPVAPAYYKIDNATKERIARDMRDSLAKTRGGKVR